MARTHFEVCKYPRSNLGSNKGGRISKTGKISLEIEESQTGKIPIHSQSSCYERICPRGLRPGNYLLSTKRRLAEVT